MNMLRLNDGPARLDVRESAEEPLIRLEMKDPISGDVTSYVLDIDEQILLRDFLTKNIDQHIHRD